MSKEVLTKIRGSIALEAVVTLWLWLLVTAYFLEMARRPLYELRAEWGSFLLARQAVIVGPHLAQIKVRALFRPQFAQLETEAFSLRTQITPNSIHGRMFLRFPSVFSFALKVGRKRHFELVRKCTFSFR